MPKSNRWKIKQEVEQAAGNVQKAMDRLTVTGQDFQEIHPDYYDMFCSLVSGLAMLKGAIDELNTKI